MKNLKTTFLELELKNEIKSNMSRIGKTKYLIQFFLEYTYLVILTFLTVYFHTFAPNSCEWARILKSFSFSIYGLTLQFLLIKHCSWIIWISYVLSLINTTLTFCGFHVSLPKAYEEVRESCLIVQIKRKVIYLHFDMLFFPSIHYSWCDIRDLAFRFVLPYRPTSL